MKYFNKYKILGYFFSVLLFSITNIHSAELKYVTPNYVKSVTNPYEQFNDINPNWSTNGKTISYERFDSLTHEIVLVDLNGKRIKLVTTNVGSENELELLLPEISQSHYFAFNISWAPDNKNYVFVGNGSTDNFDLYLGNTTNKSITRITTNDAIDNQAHWSPNSEQLVFVSSRGKRASLYLYDFVDRKISLISSTTSDTLNPVWSPDGNKLAFMQGEGNAFQIFIIDDIKNPTQTLRQVTNLPTNNNIRPSWSPDGKKLAFFTLNLSQSASQHWKIAVVSSHADAAITPSTLDQHIISTNVVQNSVSGPSWLPDNTHIAYVQYIDDSYNPVHLVNTKNKQQSLVLTNTKMNRDVSCSSTGTLAFQSQDEQWSRIFIAKLPGFKG